jgi:hypothetical protein
MRKYYICKFTNGLGEDRYRIKQDDGYLFGIIPCWRYIPLPGKYRQDVYVWYTEEKAKTALEKYLDNEDKRRKRNQEELKECKEYTGE